MIPVIDIGALIERAEKKESEEEEKEKKEKEEWGDAKENGEEVERVARLVHDAICQYGFCYLSNHGVSQTQLNRVFAASKEFFESDKEVKEKLSRSETDAFGYTGLEKERLLNDRKIGDMKEAINFHPGLQKPALPAEHPELSQSLSALFWNCQELAFKVFDMIGMALDLKDPGLLRKTHQKAGQKGNYTTLRTAYYPPLPLKEGQVHCGEHSDYGSISLLFQDDIGGLQIEGKDGEYRDVIPVPGTVVLNVGDALQRWTADKYPATRHRVIVPSDAIMKGRTRQSLAFFCFPDDDTLITCLDGSNTYPPINATDFLWSRFTRTTY